MSTVIDTVNELTGSADLNTKYMDKYEIVCDMGEGFGRYTVAPDAELMKYIDVANVACGFHAGDYNTMMEMVQLAKKYNVKVGSHPGLPDRMGFGRRRWSIPADEIYNMVVYQTGALKGYLEVTGMKLNHIKPHGELYFYVERDPDVMKAVLTAAKQFGVPVIGAKNKTYAAMAKEMGVDFIQELYVDIDWNKEGRLISVQGSAPKQPEEIYKRVMEAGTDDTILTYKGETLPLNFGSNPFMLCLHSDMPTGLDNVKSARKAIDTLNSKK